jgi:hypothetical protein
MQCDVKWTEEHLNTKEKKVYKVQKYWCSS